MIPEADELMMSIEEEFGIDLQDDDAARLSVLGDMHGFILRALRHRLEDPEEEEVWERLKQVVVDELGVRPEEVTREADIARDFGAE